MKNFSLRAVVSVLLLIVVSVSSLSSCTGSGADNAYEKAILTARTEIWQDINSGKAGSATIAVMDNGEIVYSEGFGMANREKSIPVASDTLFNIGSISKVFTATAIMLLVDEGKVKLDDPVTRYIPEFVMADTRYQDITVRMILSHSPGFPGTTALGDFGFEYNPDFFEQVLRNLSQSHLKHDPGAMAPYCNDGFTLAEMIVERVSGQKFIDFLTDRVFEPLDMPDTGLSIGEQPGENIALYYQAATAKREPPQTISLIGAGGLSSTAEDLCRFLDTFSKEGNRIFSKAALEEMTLPQPCSITGKFKNAGMSYGLGWDITFLPAYRSQGIQILGKSGGTPNYTSMMFTVPAHRLSVAVVESGPASSVAKVALNVLDCILVQKGLIKAKENTVSKPLAAQDIPDGYARFDGFYAPLMKISFNFDMDTVNIFTIENGKEIKASSLFYNDGYFYDENGRRSYFASVEGEDYHVSSGFNNTIDLITAQKLEEIDKPGSLKLDPNGKLWLIRNAKWYGGVSESQVHLVESSLIEGLPGYIDFIGIKEIMSPDFAGMPASEIRDQTELTLVDIEGTTWARVSEMLFSPAEGVPILHNTGKTVVLSESGYNEWLTTGEDLVLDFERQIGSRVIIFTNDRAMIYDSAIDEGEVYVPEGSFIELCGETGDTFTISTR